MTPADARAHLVYALRDDLIGPDADDPRDEVHATETLPSAPSHWYLTGFLAPTGQSAEEKEDETADETIDSGLDSADDGEPEAPVARRPLFPSSIGISVLVPEATRSLEVRVTFGTYAPVHPARRSEGAPSTVPPPTDDRDATPRIPWLREPYERDVPITLDPLKPRQDVKLPGSGGVVVRAVLRNVPPMEVPLVPPGTRYVTLFLVNQRAPVQKPEQDRGFIFQVAMGVSCAEGLVPRPNLRGARKDDDIDERIGDLQYRDAFEYAVGHGIAVRADVMGRAEEVFCRHVRTCWMPTAEVEKVVASHVDGVTLGMEALAEIQTGEAVRAAVGAFVTKYRAWIDEQAATALDSDTRRETSRVLVDAARIAAERIQRGIDMLASNPLALEAFRITNRTMAAAAWKRNREQLEKHREVPTWRPFQLAFLLMNVAAMVDPTHGEREAVDLIFFPTGGGKTEAYLGLAAFTLVLRRLRNEGLASGGVTVLMRYTLRLLTLDQLERAATLICALELERRKDPGKLGPRRFSIGLWVGKAATPNRFGTEKDRDETTARNRVLDFRKDPKANPSPIPIDKCPWCGTPFGQDTFELKPDARVPLQLRVMCAAPKCEFRWHKDWPEGIPVVGVDDEIYRELPCFLIATVDKFAGLPWVGKTGLLLGRNVTHANALGYFGPGAKPPDAKGLPKQLLPPDLIIQDELHLISGPLGTMVGLYETAIDHLTTRVVDGKTIRPKIVASTATVRRALPQIRALFARTRVDVFPPPGPNRRTSFFAETVPTTKANARLYVALAAPGRSQKVLLMRSYMALLAAAKRVAEDDEIAADPYLTLVGYFNSLRELGGSRRIVEDEVRARLMRIALRRRIGETEALLANRTIGFECVELTSRETTDRVKVAKERLAQEFATKSKNRPPVDVALASNMISVGLDIQRLGLMVVCGQPKTTAEYIQATSRVGRDDKRPGLVVALLNVHKPRDRSHFEHFAVFHESFYRGVEASSVTPFSPRAIDRGLAGVAVALARLGDARLTEPDSAAEIASSLPDLGFVGDVLAQRVEAHRKGHEDDEPIDETKLALRQRIDSLLDSWARVAKNDPAHAGLAYQPFEEGQASKRPLLRMPLDPELRACDQHERRFVANRSMRDVEGTADVYVMKLKESAVALEKANAENGATRGTP
ncbi:MAG: helicase [Deltaproteobacteria bacterium]|nr:helicase [Deltaproteobacteria bacterium]